MAAHDSAATPSEGITSTPGAGAPAYATPVDSTAIQPDSGRILLPPPPLAKPSGMSPERLAAWATRMDVLLGGLALLLAFLLGSFAIRNSDFFLYLASGRDLLQGKYSFGVDPYAHTTAGVYYINHSWLFDVALYGIYQLSGGVGVAIARAVLVTVLAALLLQIRRPGGTLWAPAACTGLAFLAISTRLLIQPATASLLFLGLTFFLLHYRNEEYDVAETSRSERRRSIRA